MARVSRKQNKNIMNEACLRQSIDKRINAKIPTAIYARLSVEDDARMESIDTQVALIQNYIEDHDELEFVESFVDNGFSGTNFERPAFTRLMAAVKKRKIKCIVVKDLSRFGRNYLESGYYIETIFPFLGVRLIAINDNFDSNRKEDLNGLILPVKNIVNAMYAKDISKKVWTAKRNSANRGEPVRTKPPYGYVMNQETKKYEVDPVAAFYVRLIFHWSLQEVGTHEIASRLNAIEAPCPRKRMEELGQMKKEANVIWQSSTISKMLHDETYIGALVYNKTSQAIFKGEKKKALPKNQWKYIYDHHEPIIAKDDFDALQERLGGKADLKKEQEKIAEQIRIKFPDHFQGKIFCGGCGRPMTFDRMPHGYTLDKKYAYYRCKTRGYDNKAVCGRPYIHENLLKMLVMKQIKEYVLRLLDVDKLLNDFQGTDGKKNPLLELNGKITAQSSKVQTIADKRKGLYSDFSSGILENDEYQYIKESYNASFDKESKILEELIKKRDVIKERIGSFHKEVERLKAGNLKDDFNPELVDTLVEKVELFNDKKIRISFKLADPWQEICDEIKEVADDRNL